ncbi:hypothetical protein [Halorientalis salina]|uniref:hypothetical protein n=1 Tax=Halorientalis salina TaxID=2932266 RepID=UPI0010AC4489|nr:hypothetical protein [Halorientalis salina]
MSNLDQIKKRDVLAGLSTICSLGIAGCTGGGNSGEDGSETNDEDSTDTPTEAAYDPQDYYGLPKCDGSRPIRLVSVNSDGTGIIQNMRGEDQLVYVKHDDGLTSGDYCGGTIVEGGEQTAYEVTYGGEPSQIEIGAVEATSRNEDAACSQSGALPDGDYTDGCVDPNTFQGFREVNNTPQDDDESDIVEKAQEAQLEDKDTPEGTPKAPIEISHVKATLRKHLVNTPWIEIDARITNNRDEEQDVSYTYTVDGPKETFRHDGKITLSGQSGDFVSHTFQISEWENVEGDSREERQEKREELFENSTVYIEYDGRRFAAEKIIS